MLKILVLIILIIAGALLMSRKRKRQINAMADYRAPENGNASSDEMVGLMPNEGDPLRFLFMKLYPAGKCVVCTTGDPRYKLLVQNALWEARNIHVDIDLEKFRGRMQALAIPEDVIEDYLSNIRLLDETSLQVENT